MQFHHPIAIILGGDVILYAPAVVDVMNFSNAEDRDFALNQQVHQHGARRLDSIIVAAFRAPKTSRRAGERPRNDSTDFIRSIEHFARDLAHSVKLGDWDDVFVRRNLKYAIA